jgi:hypothetical protein
VFTIYGELEMEDQKQRSRFLEVFSERFGLESPAKAISRRMRRMLIFA